MSKTIQYDDALHAAYTQTEADLKRAAVAKFHNEQTPAPQPPRVRPNLLLAAGMLFGAAAILIVLVMQ